MTERPSSEFDDQTAPPQRPSAEGAQPVAEDPPGEFGRARWGAPSQPWGTPPPAPPTQGAAGEAAPETGPPAPSTDGAHHRPRPASPEETGIIDPARVAAIRARVDARSTPASSTEDGEVTETYGQRIPRGVGGQLERPAYGAPHQHGAEQAGGPRAGESVPSSEPPPRWGTPPPQPPGAWSPGPQAPEQQAPGQQNWGYAQGSGSYNYADNIRSSEMVPTRRLPPRRGWRKGVYLGTFKLINLGQSPDERYQAELEAKIRSLLRGKYKIGVLGKGGVGKSTIAASVGSIFAEMRQDDRVVAVDADTAFGKLSARIDPSTAGSYWELAGDRNLNTFTDMRSRVGSNGAGLFVLPGETATARRRVLDPAVYRAATAQLDRHFTLSIVDCGSTMDSPVTREVLGDVDALIVVASPWFDGASAAGQTLDWLANGGFTALLNRTVVVVNDSDGHADKKEINALVERFGKYGQKAMTMPYDSHLRPGGLIDVVSEVNPSTRRRLLELAAECAEHFAATADRHREA